jgi:hypothetical protein
VRHVAHRRRRSSCGCCGVALFTGRFAELVNPLIVARNSETLAVRLVEGMRVIGTSVPHSRRPCCLAANPALPADLLDRLIAVADDVVCLDVGHGGQGHAHVY